MRYKIILWIAAIIILSSFASAALTDNLVRYYSFDEGTSLGYGIESVEGIANITYAGSVVNTTTITGLTNKLSGSVFASISATAGAGGACSIANGALASKITTALRSNTIAYWVYANTTLYNTDKYLLAPNETVSNSKLRVFTTTTDYLWVTGFGASAVGGSKINLSTASPNNRWMHVATTLNGPVTTTYLL
jgi:hypothetical protein